MTIETYVYIWPDGSYAEGERELQEMLQWKSDDYRKVLVDDTFDLELEICGGEDPAVYGGGS